MKILAVMIVCVASGFSQKAAATENPNSPPDVRIDECLFTVDRVDDGLRIIDLHEYNRLYWNRMLKEGEENGYPYFSKSKLESEKEKALLKTEDYLILRKGTEENQIIIEFSLFGRPEYIGKPLEVSGDGTGKASHYWIHEKEWKSVKIKWDQQTGWFSMQWTHVSLSEDGKPDWVDENPKFIGNIACN